MKKIIALSLVAAALAGSSAFGQGYFLFTSGKSQAFDIFTTPGTAVLNSTVNVGFVWGPAASTTPIQTTSGLAQTPKTTGGFIADAPSAAADWNAILNTPGWTVAQNAVGNTLVSALTSTTGAISYNGGVSFGVTGTSAGTTYTVYEIAWSSAFATPQLAAAASAVNIGWSTPFQYLTVSSIGTANPMAAQAGGFGVLTTPVPEPATIALAGLGGLSLLALRRRNSK